MPNRTGSMAYEPPTEGSADIPSASSMAQSSRCMQGLASSGWVTFGGSSPDSPPRSPIHDAWATPSAASSMAHELPMAEASSTMCRLQLVEPSAASDMQLDMPEMDARSVTTEDAQGEHRVPQFPRWSPCYACLCARRA